MPQAIAKPTRELDFGEIFSQTFQLYRANFFSLFVPFLIGYTIIQAFTFLLTPYFAVAPSLVLEELFQWFFLIFISIAVLGIIGLIVTTVVSGVAVKQTSDILEKGEANLQDSFRFAASKLPSLLVVAIITSIIIGIGLIVFVVPGIIFAIMFSLVVPAIIIEQTGSLESLSRSRRLVSKRWGKTFVVILLITIIIAVINTVVGLITGFFGSLIINTITTIIISSITQPIYVVAITLLYYSMLIKEQPLQQE
jgi:hypothetical protein